MTLEAYTGEYGYSIQITADTDLSTATSVVLKARIGEVTKSLSGTVSATYVFTATVTEDFFDVPGMWDLQLQATYASSKRFQRDFLKVHVQESL